MRAILGLAAAVALFAPAAQAQPYGYEPDRYGPDDRVSCQAAGCPGWDDDGYRWEQDRRDGPDRRWDGGWREAPCGHGCYYRPYAQPYVSYGYSASAYGYSSAYSSYGYGYAPAYGQVYAYPYGYAPAYPFAYPYRYPSTLHVYGGW